jgi:hypothetical protein
MDRSVKGSTVNCNNFILYGTQNFPNLPEGGTTIVFARSRFSSISKHNRFFCFEIFVVWVNWALCVCAFFNFLKLCGVTSVCTNYWTLQYI